MVLVLVITAVVLLLVIRLLFVFADKIRFFSTGADAGFTFSEISMFWKLAKKAKVEEPLDLYVSFPALNKAITQFLTDAKSSGKEYDPNVQAFLSKLYKYRTKINIEHDNKKGMDSTRYLVKGQRLRIILPKQGVFVSEVLDNHRYIVCRLPTQQNKLINIKADAWLHKKISVYFWRKGDAGYVFDTLVPETGIHNGTPAIYLNHTNKLLRTQKRRSVRAPCNIVAALYFMTDDIMDFVAESTPGYKCLLEDISEDGALIRVGGLGRNNVKIKIQFTLGDKVIIMYGIVRAVEYNKTHNQSRLHFECVNITDDMRNAVLTFVYDILPQEEKEVLAALSATEEDAALDETAPQEQKVTLADADKNPTAPQIAMTMPKISSQIDIDSLAELEVVGDELEEDSEE
ncbi:MAG: PilZ domain-containing protein [Treponema sp.]|nr:PilZ domain-containing protein [Treponema sp.]